MRVVLFAVSAALVCQATIASATPRAKSALQRETPGQAMRARLAGKRGVVNKLLQHKPLRSIYEQALARESGERRVAEGARTLGLVGVGMGAVILGPAADFFSHFEPLNVFLGWGNLALGGLSAATAHTRLQLLRRPAVDKLVAAANNYGQQQLDLTPTEARIFDKMAARSLQRLWRASSPK